MANLLVVDADRTQSMALGFALSAKAHAVQMCANGREALDLGLRHRPDVLLIDWMLDGALNGIDIAKSLRSVLPDLHAVLVTAYASKDLRRLTKEAGFSGFLEKPLEGEKACVGVEKVLARRSANVTNGYGLVEFDASGKFAYANHYAEKCLGLSDDAERRARMTEVFNFRSQTTLNYSRRKWEKLTLMDHKAPTVLGCVREASPESWYLFLLHAKQTDALSHPELQRLVQPPPAPAGESQQRLVVLDPDGLQRKLTARQIESCGLQFHLVECLEGALKVLRADDKVGTCLVDYSFMEHEAAQTLAAIYDARPTVRLIGVSTQFRKREFAEAGIEAFLLKPVVGETLRSALAASSRSAVTRSS